MSMFKGKAGFVIPKNKFSGSLVPIFKKSEGTDASSEETSKQPQRKTKWGADLTQDAAVKRGRALAYQARVDQITQQLKLGSLRTDNQDSKSAGDVTSSDLTDAEVKPEKLQKLELERCEAIGEILKLNPSFKVPSDYQPVVREAKVPIPVKVHPEYNFIGLICGSDGETQKRLEKDTGTTIQLFGTKTETGEKVEITPSNKTEVLSICEEVNVHISADTYEKVDAAADLIELLLSSASVKAADPRGSSSVSKDNTHVLGEDQNITTADAINSAMARQDIVQPVTGPILSFSQGHFYPNPSSWYPGVPSGSPSGAVPFNPSDQRPLFGHGPPYGFVPSSQNNTVSPRLHPPAPVVQGSSVPPAYSSGQIGHPRSLPVGTSPLVGQQSNFVNSLRFGAPQLAERPLIAAASSPGWAMPVSGGPQSLGSPAPRPVPSITPLQFPSPQVRPASASSFAPSQIRSSSALPLQSFAPQVQLNSSANTNMRPSQFPVPPPSVSPLPQSGVPRPSFTPLNTMWGTAPRPPSQGSGDFTFQPHLPPGPSSQPLPRPGMHFAAQRSTEAKLRPEPQMPSFRPAMQSTGQPVGHSFSRPPVGNQHGPPHGQFGGPNLNIHMGPRNHGPIPQFPNAAGPLPPRAGHTAQFQQMHSRAGGNFSGNPQSGPFGRRQVYDPFLPSSLPASQPQGSNSRKQESDPEYEDLMASVGVK